MPKPVCALREESSSRYETASACHSDCHGGRAPLKRPWARTWQLCKPPNTFGPLTCHHTNLRNSSSAAIWPSTGSALAPCAFPPTDSEAQPATPPPAAPCCVELL